MIDVTPSDSCHFKYTCDTNTLYRGIYDAGGKPC